MKKLMFALLLSGSLVFMAMGCSPKKEPAKPKPKPEKPEKPATPEKPVKPVTE